MKRFVLSSVLAVMFALVLFFLGGPAYAADWGDSVTSINQAQIVNPQAGDDLSPVTGLSGQTAEKAMKNYLQSFQEQRGAATTTPNIPATQGQLGGGGVVPLVGGGVGVQVGSGNVAIPVSPPASPSGSGGGGVVPTAGGNAIISQPAPTQWAPAERGGVYGPEGFYPQSGAGYVGPEGYYPRWGPPETPEEKRGGTPAPGAGAYVPGPKVPSTGGD